MFDMSLILWFSSKRRSEKWRWRWRRRKRGKRGNGRFDDDSIECKSFTKYKYKAEHSDETSKGLQKLPFTRKCLLGLNIGRVFLSALSVWFLSRVSCLMTCLMSFENVISFHFSPKRLPEASNDVVGLSLYCWNKQSETWRVQNFWITSGSKMIPRRLCIRSWMLWSCFPDYVVTSLRHVPVFCATNGRHIAAWAMGS